jgi:hypothetical protein
MAIARVAEAGRDQSPESPFSAAVGDSICSESCSGVSGSTIEYWPLHHRSKSICLQRTLQNGKTGDSVIEEGSSSRSQIGHVGARTIVVSFRSEIEMHPLCRAAPRISTRHQLRVRQSALLDDFVEPFDFDSELLLSLLAGSEAFLSASAAFL